MSELKLTCDDRKFLRQIHIDPEPTVQDDMMDILFAPPAKHKPNAVIISAEMARRIAAEYGEVNIDTYIAFRSGRSNGNKKV